MGFGVGWKDVACCAAEITGETGAAGAAGAGACGAAGAGAAGAAGAGAAGAAGAGAAGACGSTAALLHASAANATMVIMPIMSVGFQKWVLFEPFTFCSS